MAKQAPGDLALVQDFINTIDLEDGNDQISSPELLAAWFGDRGLVEPGTAASPPDLERALELRESLRDLLSANNGKALNPAAGARLDRCCADLHVHIRVRFGSPHRPLVLEPEEDGVSGALGRLLAISLESMLNGTWPRLKACAKHSCRFAFYDYSRNRSATWCRMEVCGNRVKVASYRERARRAS